MRAPRKYQSFCFLRHHIITCSNFNTGRTEYDWIYNETVYCLVMNEIKKDMLDRNDSEESGFKFMDHCIQEDFNVEKNVFLDTERTAFAETSF